MIEKGKKIQLQQFGNNDRRYLWFDDQGRPIRNIQYMSGKLYSEHNYEYIKGADKDTTTVTNGDGTLHNKTEDIFNKDRKQIERFQYSGEEKRISSHVTWEYDKNGNMICCLQYHEGEKLHYIGNNKFDDKNNLIEQKTEHLVGDKMTFNYWHKNKYNEHGDSIESMTLNEDGSIKEVYTNTPEYDKDGKRILPVYNDEDDAKVKGQTETNEDDANGNWIKKTIFYNKIPVNIYVREITYYDEPSENNPPLIHVLADYVKENVVVKVEEDEDLESNEITNTDAKWLVDYQGAVPENFSVLRYYANKYKEAPSVVTYTGPFIESITLLKELKDNMDAKEIHSYCTIHAGRKERIAHYTLAFPRYGYILHSNGIGGHWADDFEVPDNIDDGDGYIYTSQIQLLRPSEASGKRDEYFQEELEEYISLCSLTKKPDKPVINMIEVSGNSFSMVEHTVDDNFEIKDLDLNYGYGFEKFHNDLMYRFNTSSKGLVLFHGLPGTGKTYYIRHLLRKMVSNKKVVIYMPPNMVDHLVEPSFMTFLAGEVREWSEDGNFCVLLIEDAEPLLAKRQEGVRIQGVTNLLNMTDGLLNDMLNLQIICTFNVDLKKLDSALLRPGRLLARKEFKALGELDANLLAQRLGIKHHFKKPATLGEIYALRKNQNTLIHDVESDRDASTAIDDL